MEGQIRIVSLNCAGAFRTKVDRVLTLDADVYVVQEAEANSKYASLMPPGTPMHFEILPEYPKGILIFARPGFTIAPHRDVPVPGAAHVVPMTVTTPGGSAFDLWAVWALLAEPHEAAYIGQAHLALDELEHTIRRGTVMIGDYNSSVIWDSERRRNHSTLVDRLAKRHLHSAYHRCTGEPQGAETQPTFFLHRSEAKPFHIDHCFTDLEVLHVEVGTYTEWSGLKANGGVSDHTSLIVSLALPWSRASHLPPRAAVNGASCPPG